MAFLFESLLVYQKAVDFTDRVSVLTESFPRGYYFLVDQLNRAALSIATNLAEGNGRFTRPDRKNFFTIARGSGLRTFCHWPPQDMTPVAAGGSIIQNGGAARLGVAELCQP